MLQNLLRVASLCGVFFAFALPAHASEKLVQILSPKSPLKGLTWKPTEPKIGSKGSGKTRVTTILLDGTYDVKEWTLLYEYERVLLDPDTGTFHLEVPVTGLFTEVTLASVGPLGNLEQQTYRLRFDRWKEFRAGAAVALPKRWYINPGLQLSLISLADSRVDVYTETVLTAKLGAGYVIFPPAWELGVSGFITALPLSVSDPSTSVRFLGANIRLNYKVPKLRDPWRISVAVGVYYTTVYVSSGLFGYTNAMGPQLYPLVSRTLGKWGTLSAYFKFSPVSAGGVSFLSLTNRELATGVTYSYFLPNRHPVLASVDYSNLSLALPSVATGSTVSILTTSLSFGLGYGF